MTDEEIEAGAEADPDNPPASPALLKHARPVQPEERGRVSVELRLDADVLAFFQASGSDYESRINRALRDHMEHRRPRRAAG
jgi:uncharacterized protein (DUF4415 family)